MARTPPYRRSSGGPASPPFTLRRYWLPLLLLLATLAAGFAIAGDAFTLVLETLSQFAFILPILLAAAMLGLTFTAPLARRQLFAASAWPDGFRLILALALGLGALSLTTLALGTLHLLHDAIPLAPLLLAAIAGALPTWQFLRNFDRVPWRQPLQAPDFLLLLAAVPLAVLAIAVTLHPGTLWASEGNGYDVLEYHLQAPREYLQNNSTAPLHHNVYSFLPANIEMLYLLLMTLVSAITRSTTAWSTTLYSIYPAQMLHAFITLLAAGAVALTPLRLTRTARILAFLLVLAVPWTLIIGSLAYDDGGVLLYGALAVAFALAPRGIGVPPIKSERGERGLGVPPIKSERGERGLSVPPIKPPAPSGIGVPPIKSHDPSGIGFPADQSGGASHPPAPSDPYLTLTLGILLGLAVGCKMTAGVTIALPIAALLLFQRRWRILPAVTALALLCYAPWALRSAIDTHQSAAGRGGVNPVFPIAAQTLGLGHWSPAQAQQWNRGHSPPPALATPTGRVEALFQQTLLDPQWSPNYATLVRWAQPNPPPPAAAPPATHPEPPPHAAPAWPLRLGILWLIIPILFVLALARGPAAWQLLLLGAVQVLGWLLFTHLEARFLLPAVIPLALLAALALETFPSIKIAAVSLVALQTLLAGFLLNADFHANHHDASTFLLCGIATRDPDLLRLPDRFIAAPPNTYELPRLPNDVSTCLVGAATPLFYHGQVAYNTVWDDNPLADRLAQVPPSDAIQWLFDQQFSYLLVDWSEVARLRATYGYPAVISPDTFAALERAGLRRAPFVLATDRLDPATGRTLSRVVIYAIWAQSPVPHALTRP